MKINKQSNKRKIVTIFIVVLFLLMCAYLGASLKLHYWPFQTSKRTDSAQTSPEPTKNPKTNDTATQDTALQNKNSDQVPQSTTMSAIITELREDSKNVYFTATINNPSGPGTCVLTFTNKNDRPITQQVDSVTKDGQTICGEITTPALSFSYLGNWTATLRFYSGDQQTVASDIINIS